MTLSLPFPPRNPGIKKREKRDLIRYFLNMAIQKYICEGGMGLGVPISPPFLILQLVGTKHDLHHCYNSKHWPRSLITSAPPTRKRKNKAKKGKEITFEITSS